MRIGIAGCDKRRLPVLDDAKLGSDDEPCGELADRIVQDGYKLQRFAVKLVLDRLGIDIETSEVIGRSLVLVDGSVRPLRRGKCDIRVQPRDVLLAGPVTVDDSALDGPPPRDG